VTTNEERVLRGARGLKRDKVVKIARMAGCKNIVGKREKSIFNVFSNHSPVRDDSGILPQNYTGSLTPYSPSTQLRDNATVYI